MIDRRSVASGTAAEGGVLAEVDTHVRQSAVARRIQPEFLVVAAYLELFDRNIVFNSIVDSLLKRPVLFRLSGSGNRKSGRQ